MRFVGKIDEDGGTQAVVIMYAKLCRYCPGSDWVSNPAAQSHSAFCEIRYPITLGS